MRDELLDHYESELKFIRRLAAQYAERWHPVADRLLIEPEKCEDPHVERIIEAFAMLSARVRLKIDDEFPEITDALLGILYPHFLAPVPSATIVRMEADPETSAARGGIPVPRGAVLISRAVDGLRCRFRTAYPVTLYPLEVAEAAMVHRAGGKAGASPASLRLELRAPSGVDLGDLALRELRFFLDGESRVAHAIHELLLNARVEVQLKWEGRTEPAVLPGSRLRPVGFERSESLLEYPRSSLSGYRILQEYFTFPEKFLWVELGGLEGLPLAGRKLQIEVLLERGDPTLEGKVGPENFRLGCAPAVNLFPQKADPIILSGRTAEQPIVPDARWPNGLEIHSIESVAGLRPGELEERPYHPFYSLRHGWEDSREARFWVARRRPSARKEDAGTELFLSLVDLGGAPASAGSGSGSGETLLVRTTCTNRDLPSRLPFGNPRGDFELEGRAGVKLITCIRKPTAPIRVPLGRGAAWRLISHLSLNHLSIADGEGPGNGAEGPGQALTALREILALYDVAGTPATRQRLSALIGVETKRVVRRLDAGLGGGFARGVEIDLDLDEDRFVGGGAYLFASVLEAFLGLYAPLNSFCQVVARSRQRPGLIRRWPPRGAEGMLR